MVGLGWPEEDQAAATIDYLTEKTKGFDLLRVCESLIERKRSQTRPYHEIPMTNTRTIRINTVGRLINAMNICVLLAYSNGIISYRTGGLYVLFGSSLEPNSVFSFSTRRIKSAS